jgi:hypothetical protein
MATPSQITISPDQWESAGQGSSPSPQPAKNSGGSITISPQDFDKLPSQTPPPAPAQPSKPDTGIWASAKRNTVGTIEGLYHALTDPATDQEKADLLAKIQKENADSGTQDPTDKNHVPETLASNPSRATLAYHRLIDAPADMLHKKGDNEEAAARDLLAHSDYWKGANVYLSGLADKGLSAIPVAGPAINSIAQRAESGDVSGAATDALLMGAATKLPEIVRAGKSLLPVADAASESVAAAAPKGPSLVKQVLKGEKVAQAPARTALEAGAAASAEDAGVAASETAGKGVRTLLDEPIAATAKAERATYNSINKAAGTDLKTLYDYRSDVQEALEDPTNIGQRANLQKELQTTEDSISKGEALALKEGITPADLEKAKGMTQQRYSMELLKQKVFNNEGVVEGDIAHGAEESINIKAAIREIQKLDKPSRFAPEGSPTRLQQALGEEGAANLKQGLYDALKTGKSAATVHTVAKWAGIGLGSTLLGTKVVHTLAGALGGAP